MEARQRRMTENETLFREVNERVEAIASVHGSDDHVYEFYCECSNADCTVQVCATLAVYERIRSDPTHFIIAPEHALPEIERAVEKVGEAAAFAEERDPRAD